MRSSLLYEKGYASALSSYGSPSSPTSLRSPGSNSTQGKRRRDSVPVIFPRKEAPMAFAATSIGPDDYSLHHHHQSSQALKPRQTKSMNYPATSSYAWDPHIDDLDILYAKVNGLSSITPLASLSASSTIGPGGTRNDSMDDTDVDDTDADGGQPFDDLDTCQIQPSPSTTHNLPVKLLKMTNELMKTRLDILSDAISSKHQYDQPTGSNNNNDHESLVDLISGCIKHAERMEQLASAHLVSERHLRTVLLQSSHQGDLDNGKTSHDEQDRKMTAWYHDQIRQCVHLYEQQVFMTETLQDMLLDIQHYDPPPVSPTSTSPSQENNDTPASTQTRWDFSCSVASLLGLDDMQDHVQAIKYQVGLFIGEGIGTGHFIHPPRPPSPPPSPSLPPPSLTKISSPTFSIDQLTLLPKHRWVPDHAMQQCQVETCSLSFSLFERRHHCRRCGLLVCQQHSQQQLPLYSQKQKPHQVIWSRVCDPCYTNVMVPSSFPSSINKHSL